ncbi:hypothetical protein [Devosia sp. A449]
MKNQNKIVDFAVEQAARQIAQLLGQRYLPIEMEIGPGCYSVNLYYDRPAIASSGTSDLWQCFLNDRRKIEDILKLHMGSDWTEHASLLSDKQPRMLDDGTFIVSVVIAVKAEYDPWGGDEHAAEEMMTNNCDLSACYVLPYHRTIQEAVSGILNGPKFDVNALKGFARDIDPEEFARDLLDLTGD